MRLVLAVSLVLAGAGLLMAGCVEQSAAKEPPATPPPAKEAPKYKAKSCEGCHLRKTPGIVSHWEGSAHADNDVGCLDCHEAQKDDLDAYKHHGEIIATIVTPRDCAECHEHEAEEFEHSHHAKGGNILHSLDNLLAEVVEGHRGPMEIPDPHNPGRKIQLNGLAFVNSGCMQCHGSQVALTLKDGTSVAPWSLTPPPGGGKAVVTFDRSLVDVNKVKRSKGKPILDPRSWPNTGIGRLNLDGSRGACSACHSRHDFSARRSRQPENCGKCHLGPDHPQKEIFEESKHGIAYRDLKHKMNLDAETWVLGKDYSAAPTCATCHMSATTKMPVTHDPRGRISWTNRPPTSKRMNTDKAGKRVTGSSPIASTWEDKRNAMKQVCGVCHAPSYVDGFYKQYDDFVELYNAKFGRPGAALMKALKTNGLISKANFDDKIEWTWFFLWHHEGRRARHGASMMAPDYSHWHGTYEVADRWYNEMIPEVREIIEHAKGDPAKAAGAATVEKLLNEILARPEHQYVTTGKLPSTK